MDTLGAERFQIYSPPGVVPEIFMTKVQGCLHALPRSQKLLTVPTTVYMVPYSWSCTGECLTEAQLDTAV